MKPSRLQKKHSKTQNDDDQREFKPKIMTSSLKTQNIPGRRTENRSSLPPPPPFSTEIRNALRMYTYIYDIIHI